LSAVATKTLKLNPKLPGLLEFGGTYPGAYMAYRGLFMPSELESVLPKEIVRTGLGLLQPLQQIGAAVSLDQCSDFSRCQLLDMSVYMRNQLLRDTDWSSMAHGLEVRVPLVDVELLKSVVCRNVRSNAGSPYGKLDLANAPSRHLPNTIIDRRKTGFITPFCTWTTQEHHKMNSTTQSKAEGRRLLSVSRDWSLFVASSFSEPSTSQPVVNSTR